MKCNELMVGDWIADKHGFHMQVTAVGNDYLYADFEGNEGDVVEFDDKSFKPYPILLTDEFFKKNDFDKNILYWSEGGAICNKDRIDGYYIIAISLFNPPTGPSANVHYVHELQQLLRLGGYTELANNVEIMTNNDK